ncbi:MAG: hypothetical protein ACFFDT_08015 [Candidatus Hodarchaeota archaeon]
MPQSEQKAFTIRLDGEVLETYLEIKQKTGLKNDAEVIRYIIKGFEQLRKRQALPS